MYYVIFIAGILSVTGFFNYHNILSEAGIRMVFYACSFVAFIMAVTDSRTKYRTSGAPCISYPLLMGTLVLSVLMAWLMHDQPLLTSLKATLWYLFAYGWFYILIKFRIPAKDIERFLIVLCALSIPVYALNALAFPSAVFGEAPEEDITRGIIRIGLPYSLCFALVLLMSINRWKLTHRPVWIVAASVAGLMIILTVVRQLILLSALMSVLFIFKKMSWVKKLAGVAVVCLVVFFVLPMIPIYDSIMELSEKQYESNEMEEEDVRIGAWRFYTYEYHDTPVTMLLGNGVPSLGHSKWGDKFKYDTDTSKYYAADVGWAGVFYHFGLVFTLALLSFMWSAFRRRKSPSRQYLNYWIALVAITSVASGPIFYYSQIVELMTGLYLVYAPENEDDRVNNPQLQQC